MIDTDIHKPKNVVFKSNINNDGEAVETFREILQTFWGLPIDEEVIKKFLTPVGFEGDEYNARRRKHIE